MNTVIRTAAFALLVASVLSCSCRRVSFEKRYCSSKTSVRGKVLAKIDDCPGTCDPINDQVNGKITYIVRVLTVYKGPKVEDNIMYLTTAVNSALCGVTLSVGTIYLFNLGSMQVSKITCPSITWSVGLCSFPTKFSSLSQAQRRFVVRNSRTNQSLCRRRPSGPSDITI